MRHRRETRPDKTARRSASVRGEGRKRTLEGKNTEMNAGPPTQQTPTNRGQSRDQPTYAPARTARKMHKTAGVGPACASSFLGLSSDTKNRAGRPTRILAQGTLRRLETGLRHVNEHGPMKEKSSGCASMASADAWQTSLPTLDSRAHLQSQVQAGLLELSVHEGHHVHRELVLAHIFPVLRKKKEEQREQHRVNAEAICGCGTYTLPGCGCAQEPGCILFRSREARHKVWTRTNDEQERNAKQAITITEENKNMWGKKTMFQQLSLSPSLSLSLSLSLHAIAFVHQNQSINQSTIHGPLENSP